MVLSVVGVDRVEGNAHFTGKRRQEELDLAGSVPGTILRATQFHEFAAMVVEWTRQGDVATVAPLLVQPVAAFDAGKVLAELATCPAHGGICELADAQSRAKQPQGTMGSGADQDSCCPLPGLLPQPRGSSATSRQLAGASEP